MKVMKMMLVAFAFAFVALLCACEDDTYGTPCMTDSDCKTGIGCFCEAHQRDEGGNCPGETGTCLSPQDFTARSQAATSMQ